MKKLLPALLFSLLTAPSLLAQDWSIGVRTGAFVFGDFVERRMRTVDSGPGEVQVDTLSAGTRAGLAVDLEHSFGERWAVRAEGTFTRAPLAVKGEGDDGGFELDAGEMDVTTLALPIIYRINRGGAFRFHLMAGPAYAAYNIDTPSNVPGTVPVFTGTRAEWGLMAGAGVYWQWTDRIGVEGSISDIATASPFRRSDFPDVPGIDIKKPHNVHTTVGIRWRF